MARIILDTSALFDAMEQIRPSWAETLFHLRGTSELLAPAILASEAGNIVHKKRPGAFGATGAVRAEFLETAITIVDLVPSDGSSRRRAAALVEAHGLSFYDAEFLELASRDSASILLTHDTRMSKAAAKALGPARTMNLDDAARAVSEGRL